jgi:hypothetical protein
MEFGIEDLRMILFSDYLFRGDWFIIGCTLLEGVSKILPKFSVLLSNFDNAGC